MQSMVCDFRKIGCAIYTAACSCPDFITTRAINNFKWTIIDINNGESVIELNLRMSLSGVCEGGAASQFILVICVLDCFSVLQCIWIISGSCLTCDEKVTHYLWKVLVIVKLETKGMKMWETLIHRFSSDGVSDSFSSLQPKYDYDI